MKNGKVVERIGKEFLGEEGLTKGRPKESRMRLKVLGCACADFPRAFPPLLLKTELLKITPVPERIYVTHIKPQYDRTIQKELRGLRIPHLRVLKDGETIRI